MEGKTIHVTVVNKKVKKRATYRAEIGVESRESAAQLLEEYLEAKNQAFKMRECERPPPELEKKAKKAKTRRARSLQTCIKTAGLRERVTEIQKFEASS